MDRTADMVVKMLRADAHIDAAMNGVPVEHTRQHQAAEAIAQEFNQLRAEVEALREVLKMVDTYYSASLDWQPPYVFHARVVLAASSGGEGKP